MKDLKQSLLSCGYKGPCENLNILKWCIRTGACSQFFLDLILWLENQLQVIVSSQQVRDNISRLFSMMRQSILMRPSYGSEAAINPEEFRLQTLKVLVKQLQLRQLPSRTIKLESEKPQRDHGNNVEHFKELTITLNIISDSGNSNQRVVRFNRNSLEI